MDPVVLDIGDLLPLGALWGTALGFIVIFVAVVVAIGMGSRNLSVGAFGGYLAFIYFAMETEMALLQPLLYATVVLVILGAVFKLWRLEGFETGA